MIPDGMRSAMNNDHWKHRLLRAVPHALLAGITLVGTALRVYQAGTKPLWFDEAIVFWISRSDLATAIELNASGNSAPPLFIVALSLLAPLGTTEGLLRLLPIIASALCIPAMYMLGRLYLGRTAALLPALLIAVAPIQIQYAQQLREYSLSVLLAILLLAAGVWFSRLPTPGRAAVFAATIVLAVFTQYGLALLAAGLSVATLVAAMRSDQKRRAVGLWALTQLAFVGAVAAVYQVSLARQFVPGGFGGTTYLASRYWTGGSLQSAAAFVHEGATQLVEYAFAGSAFLLVVLVGAICLLVWRQARPAVLPLALPLLITAGAGLLRLYPLGSVRQDLFLTPSIYLIAGIGLAYISQLDRGRVLLPVLALLLLRTSDVQLRDYYRSDGMSSVGRHASQVASSATDSDGLFVCNPADPVVRYYLDERYPRLGQIAEGLPQEAISLSLGSATRWILLDPSCGDTTPLIEELYHTHRVQLVDQGISSILLRAN